MSVLQIAGFLFNKGKALSMLGKLEAADSTYQQALDAARGVDPSSYAKAAAAKERLPSDLVRELQCAVEYLEGSCTEGGVSWFLLNVASIANEKGAFWRFVALEFYA